MIVTVVGEWTAGAQNGSRKIKIMMKEQRRGWELNAVIYQAQGSKERNPRK